MKTYSDGKLNKNDDGDLKIATYIKDGRMIVDFGSREVLTKNSDIIQF